MIRRKILIALAVFLFGLLVYLLDLRRENLRADKAQENKRVILLSAAEITSFTIANTFGVVSFRKDTGSWMITSPVVTLADQSVVQAILGNLAGATKHYEFPLGNWADSTTYGLDRPRIRIAVEGSFVQEPGTIQRYYLMTGKSSTTGQYYAMMRGESTAFAISGYLRNQINQSLYNFRDKRIIYNKASSVFRMEIENVKADMVVIKDANGNWALEKPFQQTADKKYLDSILSLIGDLRIQQFEDNVSTPIAKLGLEPPAMRLTVESAAEIQASSASTTVAKTILRVGDYNKQNQAYWAMHENAPSVFQIPSKGFDELKSLEPKDFRNRSLWDFSIPTLTKMEIRYGKTTLLLDRDPVGIWRFRDDAQIAVDQKKVYKFLQELKSLDISQFLSERPTIEELQSYQLYPPKREIRLFGEEGKKIGQLALGKLYDEKGLCFYSMSGDTSSVLAVSLSSGLPLAISKDSLVDHRIFPDVSKFKGGKLSLQVGKSSGILQRRSDGKWLFKKVGEDSPAEGYVVDGNKVDNLLYSLSAVESKASVTSGSDTIKRANLETPAIRMDFWPAIENLTPSHRVTIGSMTVTGNASILRLESKDGEQYHVISIEDADGVLSSIENLFQ